MEILTGFIILIIVLLVILRRRAEAPVSHPEKTPSASSRPSMDKRHQHAARYIRNSGDTFAIRELDKIKERPEAYNYYFWKYADENATLKIALGLLAGYLTWELLSDDSRDAELQTAMSQLDSDLENDKVPWEGHVDQQQDFVFENEASGDGEEMDRLYADLDDTAYFDEMMDG